MSGMLAKPVAKRHYRTMVRRLGRRSDRRVPRAVGRVHSVVRTVIGSGKVFRIDDVPMRVERRLRSTDGPRADIVLVRTNDTAGHGDAVRLRALQVRDLERMAADHRLTLANALGEAK